MQEPANVCTDCDGTGLTGEQSYERISNEGGIWHNILCPTCQVDDEPTIGKQEADRG
jgi:hypothetical protein